MLHVEPGDLNVWILATKPLNLSAPPTRRRPVLGRGPAMLDAEEYIYQKTFGNGKWQPLVCQHCSVVTVIGNPL